MNRSPQARWWLAFCAAGQLMIFPLPAENSTPAPAPVQLFSATNSLPPAHSPVDLFRQLLAMSPDDRENFLTNKPPEVRERILDKVSEYEALDPDERELRLRATELRWYLIPLLRESSTNRAARLAQIPADIRELVQNRLEEWIILPPPLQQEFLENERTLRYFTYVDSTNDPSPTSEYGGHYGSNDADQGRWNALSENERRQITAQVNRFFELTPDEKQKTLNTLSDAERAQMEKTLQSFEKMPAAQRAECIRAFTKFASMNTQERGEFLKNAERWSEMSPAERQAWRDLVVNVPQWPPLPFDTIASPPLPPDVHPAVATNGN
jgi:hypothetical protein